MLIELKPVHSWMVDIKAGMKSLFPSSLNPLHEREAWCTPLI